MTTERIAVDTNVLLRALLVDDAAQSAVAQDAIRSAATVCIPTAALCELVWVLGRGYRLDRPAIAGLIRDLLDSDGVVVDHAVVEAGLAVMAAGGDFADGAIAMEGFVLGADRFVTFDRDASALVAQAGIAVRALA